MEVAEEVEAAVVVQVVEEEGVVVAVAEEAAAVVVQEEVLEEEEEGVQEVEAAAEPIRTMQTTPTPKENPQVETRNLP